MSYRLVGVLALAGLCLAGCSGASGATHPTTTTTTVPFTRTIEAGGTVVIAVPSLPSEFNPWTPSGANAVTAMVMAQVWPQAFVVNGSGQVNADVDAQGLPTLFGPAGAELESVKPETVVYSINRAAHWSDGVPITATDFIYNWREQPAFGSSLPADDPLEGYEDIKSITGSNNNKTVTVVFAKPYADWEALFSDLVPAHVGERYGWVGTFSHFDPAKVISGGPFIIKSVVPHHELVLERNPHYWANRPQLDRIIFRVEPSTQATVAGLENGTIDIAQLTPNQELNEALDAHPQLNEQPSASPILWQLAFNLADPELNDAAIRQGIAVSIDRHQLVSNTVGFSSSSVQTSGNRIYASGAPGSVGNDGAYAQVEASEASTLFAQANDLLGTNGYLVTAEDVPVKLSLVAPSGNPVIVAVEQELQAQLLQVGVTLTVHNVGLSELLNNVLPTGRYELALVPYLVSAFPSTTQALYSDPVGPTPVTPVSASEVTSSSIATPVAPKLKVDGDEREPDTGPVGAVTRDVLGYEDPQVTALFSEASSELNTSSEADLYNELDADLWRDMPTLPLFQMPTLLVTNESVVNVSDTQTLVGPLWDAQDWAIESVPPPTTSTTG